MNWIDDLDPRRAISNLTQEKTGDWYRDPWDWPEYEFLNSTQGQDLIRSRLVSNSLVSEPSKIDVPKENFGTRPAVILSVGDRVIYQTLVDGLSSTLIGDLAHDVYGWRLRSKKPSNGVYARQDFEWIQYRNKLSIMADLLDHGLKTDITSFFASLDPEIVVDTMLTFDVDAKLADRLSRMLLGWKIHSPRSGIPQRSTASSTLANMMLRDADRVLQNSATPVFKTFGRQERSYSFARWMDDMWLFGNDESVLRSGQVDLQGVLDREGLVLNSGKTMLLSGDELVEATKKIRSSAIDGALDEFPLNSAPLEELVDQVFVEMETVDRSTVRFISSRMRDHGIDYRVDDLLELSVRIPHAADHLGRLFRRNVPPSTMQDWLVDYVDSSWSRFEWATAQFAIAIAERPAVGHRLVDLYVEMLSRDEVSVPLAAVTIQRLSIWDRDLAMDLIKERLESEASPQIARVLCLAALDAGATPAQVRRWLSLHDENYLTMLTLEARSFSRPRIAKDYR